MDSSPDSPNFKVQLPPAPKQDWDLSELYSKALKIIKKHKVLWIFGAALGGIGSSNFNSSNFSSEDFENFNKIFDQGAPSREQVSQVLGESTSFLQLSLGQLVSQIPFHYYLILGIEILLLVILGLIISVIYKAWVEGSLLTASQKAVEDETPTISSSSESAFRLIKPFIWLDIVPGLVITLALLLTTFAFFMGFVFGNTAVKVGLGILAIAAVLAFVYAYIVLTLTLAWAKRKLVLEKIPAKKAFFESLRITKKKYWASALLGIVNNIVALIVIVVPIVILLIIIVGSFFATSTFADNTPLIAISLVPLLFILILAFLVGFTLLGGIINAFKAVVWTLAYNKIKGKYDRK